MSDWAALEAALEQHKPTVWWRDDDAVAGTPQLEQLLKLAESAGAPITLAVIPGRLSPSLPPAVKGRNVTIAVHGWTHTNHAPASEKKAEFRNHRPSIAMANELKRGKTIIDEAFNEQALPLFIPPWNRMTTDLPLYACGYTGVSIFGQRDIITQDSIIRFDAHLDPIDWRSTRSVISDQVFINKIIDLLKSKAPIGLMTHHLVHDEAIWSSCTRLITLLTRKGANWISAGDLLTRVPK